jgi:hypothetical protein
VAAGSWAAGGDRIRLAFVPREISGRRIRKVPLQQQRGPFGLSLVVHTTKHKVGWYLGL